MLCAPQATAPWPEECLIVHQGPSGKDGYQGSLFSHRQALQSSTKCLPTPDHGSSSSQNFSGFHYCAECKGFWFGFFLVLILASQFEEYKKLQTLLITQRITYSQEQICWLHAINTSAFKSFSLKIWIRFELGLWNHLYTPICI